MPKAKPAPEASVQKLLYGREEAAFALSLSVSEIDRMISRQEFATCRYGRRVLIPASDVTRVANLLMGAATSSVNALHRR